MAGTFTWVPDRGYTRNVKPSVTEVQFGDGYSQRTGDGINVLKEDLSLSFSNRTRSEIDAIDSFFSARYGAEWFDYTDFRGVTMRYVCQSWSPLYNHDGDCSLTCVWKRVYES